MIDLEIQDYPLIQGYYSIGLFATKYPEIEWIVFLDRINDLGIAKLRTQIDHALGNHKKVALIIWDENVIYPVNDAMTDFFNSYADKPVWLITQFDQQCQKLYTFQHRLTCKMIELPWWWLNDVLIYYQVQEKTVLPQENQQNYLCMINRISEHKLNMIKELIAQGLDQYGLITISARLEEFSHHRSVKINSHKPYTNLNTVYQKMAAQTLYPLNDRDENIWISSNVENYLHIEKTYADIPLIVHPETGAGIFQNSEKSLWPLLLGKMLLVHGRPGLIKSIQRFYDFDISRYADLSFDSVDGYDDADQHLRLRTMLHDNAELIKNSKQIYAKYQNDLETARWSIGKNLLDFCRRQIDTVVKQGETSQ